MNHARPDYDRIQDPAGLIPDDEPVFLLRGQDQAAAGAVLAWAKIAESLGASADIVALARQHAEKMDDWHSEVRGKLPDLPG
jgi:hypothetical protein